MVARDGAGGPVGTADGPATWGALPAGALEADTGEAVDWGEDGEDGSEGVEAVMGEDPQAVRNAATDAATPVTASTSRGRRRREGIFMVILCVGVGCAC